ncbi:acyl-homoserine-lactone synthase, partial [Agrobacterium vitis]|uniref:acyl-homoserine-lactone synthase n=1 Tax=Agrobacterium vitis TaxID=373 RepID=UPI002AC8C042
MLILTASPDRYVDRSNLLKQMHCLRAAVFRERLEWEVTITEAGERDEYDDFDPTYKVAITDDERRCCTDQISTVSVYVAAIENSLIDHP